MQNIAAANAPTRKIPCCILWISSLNVAMLFLLSLASIFLPKTINLQQNDQFTAEQ